MRYLIADLVTEYEPKYDSLKKLAEPFVYEGDRATDICIGIDEARIQSLLQKMEVDSDSDDAEGLAVSSDFNRKAIRFDTMLVHSSALVLDGKAYLFSADSGVGKSTHTRLWLKKYGNRVHIMNDDKPVVRIYADKILACGTPFDGGSGIALNETYPLGAIIFLERGEENSVRVPSSKEIIQHLYFQTARTVGPKTAEKMLDNFEKLIVRTRFLVLTCNMDVSAAETAYQAIRNLEH